MKTVDFKGFSPYNGRMEDVVSQAVGPQKYLAELAPLNEKVAKLETLVKGGVSFCLTLRV
ncbi:MAG: hypothetical protein LBL83_02245 [Clostridiales bacterium]|nr:hypothetical protein [Clostridiales bacterium]